MHRTKPHTRVAAAGALEPVVVEGGGNGHVAALAVGVAHQAALLGLDVPAPAYGHVLGTMGDVGGAVLVVLGLVERGKGAVVHPNAVAVLHGNGIGPVIGLRLLEVDVADDNVVGADAENANLVHHKGIRADKAEVAHVLDVEPGVGLGEVAAVVTLERAAEPDDGGRVGAFLLVLGALQEPGLKGLAVIEVQHLAATPLTAGHAGALAHQGSLIHSAHGRR